MITLSTYFLLVAFVISLVLSHHNKNLKRQTNVTAQFYLDSKGKYILKVWRHANPDPKDVKRRDTHSPILAPLFICFFSSPWVCPEAQAGIKIARRNINNLRYADDSTLMEESEEELKSLLMKVKEESEKVGLKLNI